MRLKNDRDALESLPLKLVIVAVVASLSVIPAGQALDGFRNREFANRAQLEVEKIVSAAQVLMLEGPGGVRTVHLNLENAGRLAIDRIMIGDEKGGPNMTAVVLRFATGASIVRTATSPEVWLMGPSGRTLVVSDPSFDLRLSTKLLNRTAFVLAERI